MRLNKIKNPISKIPISNKKSDHLQIQKKVFPALTSIESAWNT